MKNIFFQTKKQADLHKIWKKHKRKGSAKKSPWSSKKRKSSTVQSLLLKKGKDGFSTLREARKWIKDNGYKAPKVDVQPKYYRFRQVDPSKFVKDSFITKKFSDRVQAVIGIPK